MEVLYRIIKVQPELEGYFKYQEYQIKLLRTLIEERDKALENSNDTINRIKLYINSKIQDCKINIQFYTVHRDIEKIKEYNKYLSFYKELEEVIKSENNKRTNTRRKI